MVSPNFRLTKGLSSKRLCFRKLSSSSDSPILTYVKDNIGFLVLNRPSAYNAFSYEMYDITASILKDFNQDKNVHAVVFTGKGKFFTAGNDIKVNTSLYINETDPGKKRKGAEELVWSHLDHCIRALIDLDKLLIGCINGPGIGVGTTILGLMDYVVCHEDAFFSAPFTQLGLNAEFCSSVTFPATIGHNRTADLFVAGRKMTAKEGHDWGLISKLVTKEQLQGKDFLDFSHNFMKEMLSKSTVSSLLQHRRLTRDRKVLHEARQRENELLVDLFQDEETTRVARGFLERKKK